MTPTIGPPVCTSSPGELQGRGSNLRDSFAGCALQSYIVDCSESWGLNPCPLGPGGNKEGYSENLKM